MRCTILSRARAFDPIVLNPVIHYRRTRAKKIARLLEDNYYTLMTTGAEAVEAAWEDYEAGFVSDEYLSVSKIKRSDYCAALDLMFYSLDRRGLLSVPAAFAGPRPPQRVSLFRKFKQKEALD